MGERDKLPSTRRLLLKSLEHLDGAAEALEEVSRRHGAPGARTAAVIVRGVATALPAAPLAEDDSPPSSAL